MLEYNTDEGHRGLETDLWRDLGLRVQMWLPILLPCILSLYKNPQYRTVLAIFDVYTNLNSSNNLYFACSFVINHRCFNSSFRSIRGVLRVINLSHFIIMMTSLLPQSTHRRFSGKRNANKAFCGTFVTDLQHSLPTIFARFTEIFPAACWIPHILEVCGSRSRRLLYR